MKILKWGKLIISKDGRLMLSEFAFDCEGGSININDATSEILALINKKLLSVDNKQ